MYTILQEREAYRHTVQALLYMRFILAKEIVAASTTSFVDFHDCSRPAAPELGTPDHMWAGLRNAYVRFDGAGGGGGRGKGDFRRWLADG